MTNKEAIEKLERHKMMNCHGCVHPSMVGWCEEHCQLPKAFDMAINALQAQDLNKQVTGKLNFADDTISRQAAIDAIRASTQKYTGFMEMEMYTDDDAVEAIINLPSAQPDYQEVLGWLLAYHTKSFDLHGRYLPHEVISWLINDFTKEFIAERRTDE